MGAQFAVQAAAVASFSLGAEVDPQKTHLRDKGNDVKPLLNKPNKNTT